MDYSHKYKKYKLKYIMLKKVMTGGAKRDKKIRINTISTMDPIGSFIINNHVVVGNKNNFKEYKNLVPGIYRAYNVNNDSLMIIHDDYGYVTRYLVDEWKWKPTNITVRSGSIGFFDSAEIHRDSKPAVKPFSDFYIARPTLIKNPAGIPDELEGADFGVVGTVGKGVAPVELYIVDDMRAILIGSNTMELYTTRR